MAQEHMEKGNHNNENYLLFEWGGSRETAEF